MTKQLFVSAIAVFLSSACFADTPEVYGTRSAAIQAAQNNCAETGQRMKSGTNNDHTGRVDWNNSTNRGTQNIGAQNNYTVGGKAEASGNASPAIKASGNISGGYERKGSQTNQSNNSQMQSGGYYYYKCE